MSVCDNTSSMDYEIATVTFGSIYIYSVPSMVNGVVPQVHINYT